MPQPFLVPTVCRFTVNGSFGPRKVANIIDMHIDTTGSTHSREEVIPDQAGIILNQWTSDILPNISYAYVAESVSWLDLNSDDGTVGERSSSGGHNWPTPGGFTGSSMPGNVAILVRKLISGGRGSKNGRMYLVGVDESYTFAEFNNITASILATLNTKVSHFLDNINQSVGLNEQNYTSLMVVSHILTRYPPKANQEVGSPHTGIGHGVQNLVVDSTLATQRRRLRG